MSSNDNNKIMKKEPEQQVDDDERYCDNEKCPYASYICFEELEKYRGKPWVCAKCVYEDNEEIVIQTGDIYGESLKGMTMGKIFIDCEIDEEECYVIELYEPKETEDRGWMAIMRFRITALSREYHEVHYNKSSAFAR